MTTGGDEQLGEDAKRLLLRLFAAVNSWRDRTQVPSPPPAAGSSLWSDNEIAHPYELSHAAIGALVSAVDHLDALRALVQDAHVLHARAPFTLLRAALESSAIAVWLLAPVDSHERLLRRLRLQWDDSRDGEKAARLVGAKPRLTRDEWKGKLEKIARAGGLSQKQIKAVTTQKATYSSIVETAGSEAEGLTGTDARFCWMAASGIAHARLWAVLSAVLNRVGVLGAPEGYTGVMLSASDQAVILVAGVTGRMVSEGWRLLDKRGQADSA